MKQTYSVEINNEGINTHVGHGMTLKQAVKMAMSERKKGNDAFITWFRASDGQHGYYNEGEGHTINYKMI